MERKANLWIVAVLLAIILQFSDCLGCAFSYQFVLYDMLNYIVAYRLLTSACRNCYWNEVFRN